MRDLRSSLALAAALTCVVAGCADGGGSATGADDDPHDGGAGVDASGGGGGDAGGGGVGDPFAAQPDEGTGLTDVSADLEAVLEDGALAGACARYEAGPAGDRRARLLCGKELFFFGTFDAVGPPRLIFTVFLDHFADLVGPGFARYGMIADPYDPDGMPLGLAPAQPLGGTAETVAYTCASCHFAELPDGRYAVGAPNHQYDYGKQLLLMMTVLPLIGGGTAADHHADAIAAVQPFLARLDAEPALRLTIGLELLPLAQAGGATAPTLTRDQEGYYAGWKSGVLDAFAPPLPLDDEVHVTTKIHALWGLAGVAEAQAAGAPHMMLGWVGGGRDLDRFLQVFLLTGAAPPELWPVERLAPLADYLLTLRAPANPAPAPAELITRGEAVFRDACIECHGGPRGMGREIYRPAELGVDDQIARMMDPELSGDFCCGYEGYPDEAPTHGVKAPRLVGLWAMSRFLHNGSVGSLAELLCLTPRAGVTAAPDADGGHEVGCELSDADRRALIGYLEAH